MSAPAIMPEKPDAALLEAWGRRSVAHAICAGLPFLKFPDGSPEMKSQVDIMDEAERVILAATATTPQGVAVQLWTALANIERFSPSNDAVNIMDLDWFLIDEHRFDWPVRLILSALKSLRAMQAGGAA